MATVYSNYSSGWKPSGSSVTKKYRSRLDYSTSSGTTSVTITASCYANINSPVNAPVSGSLNLAGSSYSGSGNFDFDGSTTLRMVSSKSKTISRGKSAKTVTVSASVWSSKGDWTGQHMTASHTITISALPKYTVTFNANGHGTAPANQTVFHGDKATKPANPTAPGYRFKGWYTDPFGLFAFNFSTAITSNKTLYAKWTRVPVYCKVNDQWQPCEVYVKIDGVWKTATDNIYVKVNGVWELIQ